jgi:hypothetical protein
LKAKKKISEGGVVDEVDKKLSCLDKDIVVVEEDVDEDAGDPVR